MRSRTAISLCTREGFTCSSASTVPTSAWARAWALSRAKMENANVLRGIPFGRQASVVTLSVTLSDEAAGRGLSVESVTSGAKVFVHARAGR